ncbi:MAG: dienelactone hydrolase family protein [Verrucomicrobiota bacterium]
MIARHLAIAKQTVVLALLGSTLSAPALEVLVKTLPAEIAGKTTSLNPDFLILATHEEVDVQEKPLIIYLHGGGGKGTNLAEQKPIPRIAHSLAKYSREPVWIVVPQVLPGPNEDGKIWLPKDLNVLLDHVLVEVPCDPDRVYLTGFSMGGYGSWVWGAASPERFAAVVPVAGGLGIGGPKDITPDLEQWAATLATVPVWAFHGGEDLVVPTDRSELIISLIQSHEGHEARLTVFPAVRHGSDRPAYDNPELVRWLLEQRRKDSSEE